MYSVDFFTGDYVDRQRAANKRKCACYVEHHFNGSSSRSAQYALVVVASNGSSLSRRLGEHYAREVSRTFGIRNNGVLVGGYQGRGNGNLRYTSMPAVLLEPFFITNPQGAVWAASEPGREKLAVILRDSIVEFFPGGGRVGFSVGHKYKRSSPNDRGVQSLHGDWEADLAELVLVRTKQLLEAVRRAAPDDDDQPIPAADVAPWAADAQKFVVAHRISDGTRPKDTITREEFWTSLHRYEKWVEGGRGT